MTENFFSSVIYICTLGGEETPPPWIDGEGEGFMLYLLRCFIPYRYLFRPCNSHCLSRIGQHKDRCLDPAILSITNSHRARRAVKYYGFLLVIPPSPLPPALLASFMSSPAFIEHLSWPLCGCTGSYAIRHQHPSRPKCCP